MRFGKIQSLSSLPSARALGVMGAVAVFGVSGCGDEDYDDDAQPETWTGAAVPTTTGDGTAGTTSGVVGDMPEEVRLLDGDTGGGTTGGGAAGPGGVNYDRIVGAPSYPEDGATAGTGGAAGSDGAPGEGDAVAALPVGDLSDGQIVFVADTLNTGEVDQARAALPLLTDEATRAFAQRMIDEHEPASEALLDVADAEGIASESSDVATALGEESDAVIAQLVAADQNTVDALYIETQIAAHMEASGLLEGLIDAADSEALQMQLGTLHTTVQTHLEQATALSSEAGALK